jgi:GT2 family glycosyltransferase
VPQFVSVLIVNYNGGHHLVACLHALERQSLPRYRFEVIVVDNASADRSADIIPTQFPWVRLVRSAKNLGFAAGNNFVAKFAHSRTIVLLNNDTIPDPYWLEELLAVADDHHSVASKLVFAHDPASVNSGGLMLLRDGRGADVGFRCRDDGRYEGGGAVFAGCAAAILTTLDENDHVLDPDYFVYYEDLDAGWRSQLSGVTAAFAPRSLVRHVHGAAAGDGSATFRYHVERNRALTSLRNGDPPLAVWSGLILLAKVPQALARASLGRIPWRNAWAVVRAVGAYVRRIPRSLLVRYDLRTWHLGGTHGCASS